MENKDLIFIPDISGFVRFANSVEIEHSQQIISKLLEVIIDASQMNLKFKNVWIEDYLVHLICLLLGCRWKL